MAGDKMHRHRNYCGWSEHVNVMSFRLPFHYVLLDHTLAANQSHTCRGDGAAIPRATFFLGQSSDHLPRMKPFPLSLVLRVT